MRADSREIVGCSPSMEQLLGFGSEELLGESFATLFSSPMACEAFERSLEGAFRDGRKFRHAHSLRRRDGSLVPCDHIVIPLGDNLGLQCGTVHMIRDRTELGDPTRTLRRLLAVLDASPDFIALADPEENLEYLNLAGRKLLGMTETEDVTGHTIADFVPAHTLQWLREEVINTALERGRWTGEAALMDRTGREIPVWQAILAHRDPEDGRLFLSAVARDLTERLELEAHVQQAQKMEAVGWLAGGIAHDFNNILTRVLGAAANAMSCLSSPEIVKGDLAEIIEAGRRAAELTERLFDFSRNQANNPSVLDLNVVLAQSEPWILKALRKEIRLVVQSPDEAVLVWADPVQIQQVILNLVINADDAMKRGGTLRIECGLERLAEARHIGDRDVAAGTYARLSVEDTGEGMTSDVVPHIFEPFFTTKRGSNGTGLGLATVYGIVCHAGGAIEVNSVPGSGARFCIFFPVAGRRGEVGWLG